MRSIRAAWLRFRGLLPRAGRDRDLADELEAHLEAHIDDNVRAGLSPGEARRQALLALGGVAQVTERYRDRRGVPLVETLMRDSRYALRTLGRSPGFAAASILTLALGLGATTAIFSVVNGVLLEPMRYPEANRLYLARTTAVAFSRIASTFPVNAQFFHTWRTGCRSCEQVALVEGQGFTLNSHGEPERLAGLRVSSNFFHTLGVAPSLGRDFTLDEERSGRSHVVLLSDTLWRSRFDSDPSIVGRTIVVDGEPHDVIGVLPASLHLPTGEQWGPLFAHDRVPLIFRPLGFDVSQASDTDGLNYSSLIRLKSNVNQQAAADELNALIAERARQIFNLEGFRALLIPLKQQVTSGAREALWLLLGAIAAVLLIICVNVGNLMLARTTSRQREASIRLALGASRSGLFGLVLHEALIIVAVGGALGTAMAYGALKVLVAAAPADLPRIDDVQLDWRVFAFAALTIVGATLVCGLAPAWRLATIHPQESLKAGSLQTTATRHKRRLSEVMVGFEVAISAVLLVIGGLLLLSFFRLMHVEKGFDIEHVMTQGVSLMLPKYREAGAQTRFIDEVLLKLGGAPGVRAVAVTNQVPLHGETWIDALGDSDMPPEDMRQSANYRFVSPAYWSAMGIALERGRFIDAADRNRSVAVLSAKAARALWPNESAIGKHIHGGGPRKPRLEVVGVVSDIREGGLMKDPPAMVYEPYWATDLGGPTFVLRTSAPATVVATALREAVRAADPEVPLTAIQSMEEILEDSVAARRFQMYVAGAFAMSALLLACLGIYGVVSFSVASRRKELAVRRALGASSAPLITLVMRQGMQPVLLGLLAGLTTALVFGRVLASQLYAVGTSDALTLSSVSLLLVAVALCACWVPARRATRIDPLQALRFD